MSPFGAHIEALQAPVVESSREKFFRILFHDDRDSFYFVSSDASGAWFDTALKASALASYQFKAHANYYVTHHGYNRSKDIRRLSERTRQLNALFFDLDCHREPLQANREKLIGLIQERLTEAIIAERIPMPTLIVDSGRGVQLYYVLRRSIPCRFARGGDKNTSGITLYESVQRRLADTLENLMEGLDLVDLDRTVFDKSRVGRIPDTFNTKAGRCAHLVNACEAYYDLPLLAGYCPDVPKKTAPSIKSKGRKPAFIMKFNALQMSRLNKVSELQEYRKFDCEGNRELMCFVYYNAAVQVYDKENAEAQLNQFNNRFLKPLPSRELKGIMSSVNRVKNVNGNEGYYILSAQKVIELLGLTEAEIEATGFFQSKRMAERIAAKQKTKNKRESRNSLIVDLYESGSMTQEQVAKEAGCSVRTVRSVLKEAGLTRLKAAKTLRANVKNSISLKTAARTALDAVAQEKQLAINDEFSGVTITGKILSYVSKNVVNEKVGRALGPGFLNPDMLPVQFHRYFADDFVSASSSELKTSLSAVFGYVNAPCASY